MPHRAAQRSAGGAAAFDPEGRFAKVHWILDALNERFAKIITPGELICIDETMIKYRGRHPSVMLMPNKPLNAGLRHS